MRHNHPTMSTTEPDRTRTRTFVAAPISDSLVAEMDRVHQTLRQAESPRRHAREGVDLILRITEECLDYYFLRSTERLGFGAMAQQAVKMGLKTSMSGIGMFVRQLGKSMSDQQVLDLADMVEEMLLEVEIEEDDREDAGGERVGSEG